MKAKHMASAMAVTASLLLAIPGLGADAKDKDKKLDKAKNTVDNIRQADPPKVSTGTAKSDPKEISDRLNKEEKERRKAAAEAAAEKARKHPIIVPSPVDKNNPNGDKDVREGFDKHQKEYKAKTPTNPNGDKDVQKGFDKNQKEYKEKHPKHKYPFNKKPPTKGGSQKN